MLEKQRLIDRHTSTNIHNRKTQDCKEIHKNP